MRVILIAVWCALAVLVATSGTAVTQEQKPFRATDYPVTVRKVLSSGVLTCKQSGGGKLEFGPDTVQKVDLNGDGRLDHVVQFGKVRCPEMEHIFCGTGGCDTHFLVTMPDGAIRTLFAGTVDRYEIPKGRPLKVRFDVHHSICEDGDPTKGCQRTVRIGYRSFDPTR